MPNRGPHFRDGPWSRQWSNGQRSNGQWSNGTGFDGAGFGGPPWRPPRAFILWAPVVLSALAQIPASFWIARSGLLAPWAASITVALAVFGPLVLLLARRFPGPVVAAVCAAASLDLLVDRGAGPPYVALAFAVVGGIARGARLWTFISVAVAWAGTISVAIALGGNWNPFRVAGITFGILVLLGVGEFLRTRRQRWYERREEWHRRRQTEVQAERVRIARELHDVLAHSLSSINVQAGVGLHLMDRDPAKAAEALAVIKETSRSALDEVRSVLGVLRSEDPAAADAPLVPEPDLSRLAGLAASFAGQGLDVRVSALPENLPGPLQLALYRIVQEALTNVGRHSTARHAEVVVMDRGGSVSLSVRDDGAPRPGAEPGGGRGLLGMRERAELLGGTFDAGPAADGGFVVRAELPLRSRQPEGTA